MSFTLAEAQDFLTRWKAAEKAVAAGQSYRIGDRTMTRADAAIILERIQYWSSIVDQLSDSTKSGPTVLYAAFDG